MTEMHLQLNAPKAHVWMVGSRLLPLPVRIILCLTWRVPLRQTSGACSISGPILSRYLQPQLLSPPCLLTSVKQACPMSALPPYSLTWEVHGERKQVHHRLPLGTTVWCPPPPVTFLESGLFLHIYPVS